MSLYFQFSPSKLFLSSNSKESREVKAPCSPFCPLPVCSRRDESFAAFGRFSDAVAGQRDPKAAHALPRGRSESNPRSAGALLRTLRQAQLFQAGEGRRASSGFKQAAGEAPPWPGPGPGGAEAEASEAAGQAPHAPPAGRSSASWRTVDRMEFPTCNHKSMSMCLRRDLAATCLHKGMVSAKGKPSTQA